MITFCFLTKWARKEILVICKQKEIEKEVLFLLAKYINGRFYSCLDYVYKHS